MFAGLIAEYGWGILVLFALAAVITSSIHGATGVAGGMLMAVVLANFIGVKPVVPVMSVALLISHSSRVFLNFRAFDKDVFVAIAVPAFPCIAIVAYGYGRMPAEFIAALLGALILTSIPLRRWAKSRKIASTKKTLHVVGAGYGALCGASVGPGMLLVPFMLGYGMTREAFVGTIAAIAFATNVTRTALYGSNSLLNLELVQLGIFIGLMTIPGNWLGRTALRKMSNNDHAVAVDVLTCIGALNFFWIAFRN